MSMKFASKPAAGRVSVESVNFDHGTFAVFNDENNRVSKVYRTRGEAERKCVSLQAEIDRVARRGPRPCMCCGYFFASEGIHNRLCDRCRKATE